MKLPNIKDETIEIKFNDTEIINVKQYVTISNKNDLVAITLQNSIENGVLNVVKKETYFYCYLIKMYTDIEIDVSDESNVFAAYDALESNGIIQLVINAIPDEEYYSLTDALNKQAENIINYYNSTAGLVNNLITDLPKSAAAAAQIVQEFDPEKYKEVLNFYNSVKGGAK